MCICQVHSGNQRSKNPSSIEGDFTIPWNIRICFFDKSWTIDDFCMRMLFETIKKYFHVMYIMLSICIKCHYILYRMLCGMITYPSKSGFHGSPSSSIDGMSKQVDFCGKSFFEKFRCTIVRSIIDHEDLRISFFQNTLNHWFYSGSFIVGTDEEKELIFLHVYHGVQVHAPVVWALLVGIRFWRVRGEKSRIKKQHSHIPKHPLIFQLIQISRRYRVRMEKIQKREVKFNLRGIPKNEAHCSVLVWQS